MASKSRRNKVKFKLTKELVLLLTCIVAMITATVIMAIPSRSEKALEKYNTAITDFNTKNETQYGFLDKDNVFDELDFHESFSDGDKEKLAKKLSSDEYVYVFYGSLTNGDFLQNLTLINGVAKENDVEKVYLAFSNFIDETDDKNSKKFIDETLTPIQATLNNKAENYFGDDVDLTDTKTPVLLVYEGGKLRFNSQTYKKNPEYNWNTIINKAFTIKESK